MSLAKEKCYCTELKLHLGEKAICGPCGYQEGFVVAGERHKDELRQLRQRVSEAPEECACPEFCKYHARARFEALRQVARDAAAYVEAERKRGRIKGLDCLFDDIEKALEGVPL